MRYVFLKLVRRNFIGRYFYFVCFEYFLILFKKIYLEELKWIDLFLVVYVFIKRFEECEIFILLMFYCVFCFFYKLVYSLIFENIRFNVMNDEMSEKKFYKID